jgi:hypothetical protein
VTLVICILAVSMDIRSFLLVAVEILQPLRTTRISESTANWECEPKWIIGHNPNGEVVQNIEFRITRTKKTHQGTIVVRTSFLLELGTEDYKPTTEVDFQVYTFFATLAMSHARTFFIREAKGTPFEGDILPADYTPGIRNKLVTALNINNN